jgi:hypothetical protein
LFICVTALDVETLELLEGAGLAVLNFLMIPHTLGRTVLVGSSQPQF